MQIPILSGIFTDESGDFRTAYPVNLSPVPMETGLSKGYLRPIEGLLQNGTSPGGASRGGIEWNGVCYRVLGTILVSIASNGTVTAIGSVGSGGHCTFDFSFDRLAISSGGSLYYYDGATLTKVTDVDIGTCLDIIWVDGYFMSTDGEYLVVSDLADPFSFNVLKYGSSEIDPDPINSVMKLRNEVYAVNRNTIEVFRNVGGSGFPFERITGAQIQKGSVGTFASCVFNEAIAFVGGGRNEAVSVYMGAKAQSVKIASTEVETILAGYTKAQQSLIVLEARAGVGINHLWLRLPDRTLVYDIDASSLAGVPIWYVMTGGLSGFSAYPGGDLVFCYDSWLVANPVGVELGYLVSDESKQWGDDARWEFSTAILFGEGKGVIFNSLELVCLTGRVEPGKTPTISTSYSVDGETWSQDRTIAAGTTGDRAKRLVWYKNGHMRNWRVQRFQGTSESYLSIARLDAQLEALQV